MKRRKCKRVRKRERVKRKTISKGDIRKIVVERRVKKKEKKGTKTII